MNNDPNASIHNEPVSSLRHTSSNNHVEVHSFPANTGTNRPATPQPAILKMTRSVRRQIYTSDLVFAMSTCLQGAPKKINDILDRIQDRLDNINNILYGGGKFVLSPRDYKKYNKVIVKMKKLVVDMSDGEILTPDFFNAVMMLVEDTFESVKHSKSHRLKHEWTMLRNSMATFCNHVLNEPDEFDPAWPGYKYEAMGVTLGRRFEKVIMS